MQENILLESGDLNFTSLDEDVFKCFTEVKDVNTVV